MKGFNTSKDYDYLWELIQKGLRIPAWILYSDEYDTPIYDIAEVKKPKYTAYSIGTRGRGYGFEDTKEEFFITCKSYDLEYILPNKI